jgi:PhoH-like ATPase
VVLLGDPEQIDHPYLDAINNGLTYAVERMKQEDDTGVIALKTTERSRLAEKAARLL